MQALCELELGMAGEWRVGVGRRRTVANVNLALQENEQLELGMAGEW